MIYEYALDPLLLSNWNSFQRLVSLFGITKGRLISRYPKRWARLVLDAAPAGTTEKSKIEVALRRIERELLPRVHQWTDGVDWLPNAIDENNRAPFQAILAATTSSSCSLVIDATDLDSTALPPLLAVGPTRFVIRDAEELGKALRPLLLISKKIVIVEPNFTIKSSRFRNPLAAIAKAALDLQNRLRLDVEMELHLGMDKLADYSNKSASLNAHLCACVPDRMALTVVGWDKDDVHNRYLITDSFAVMMGEGLGLPDDKSSRTDDVLVPVDLQAAEELMRRFGDTSKHKLCHRLIGTMRV